MFAYALEEPNQVLSMGGATNLVNGPTWFGDWYDINARVSDDDREAWRNQSSQHELLRSALRDLLKERCKLVIHEQPTEVPDFKLVIKKNGPKLTTTAQGSVLPVGMKLGSGGVMVGYQRNSPPIVHFYGATMEDLAMFLSRSIMRPVHDTTGLTGHYDFTVQQIDQPSREIEEMQYNWPVDPLGLELKPGKFTGLTLVIDHIERPTEN